MTLQYINQPLRMGNLDLKNRFVLPPMVTNYGTPDGLMTDRLIDFYATRAKGGVGLIIVESTAVSPEGKFFSRGLSLYDDSAIPALTKLTQIVHSYGAKILIQVTHAGRQTLSKLTGCQTVAPSSIPSSAIGEVPRELTIEEIKIIQKRFSEAAKRAYKAGFDGVEIQGAHGYLVHQFLSPRTNHRSDEYGRNFDGRIRFLIEILDGIKQVVPTDFVVGCRLNGDDYLEDGLHIEDTKKIAISLVERGVSYIHISCGTHESMHLTIAPMDAKPGFLVPLAHAVKKMVSVPVIAVGRMADPFQADAVIGEEKADLVAMGRALWADPHLPNKAMQGRSTEIRPCIGCLQGCRRIDDRRCTMNPEIFREKEFTVSPSERSKRVLVIGGGPAGLECARVAKMRGHEVSLVEESSELGGNFRLAALPPHRADIQKGIQFLMNEISRLNIPVKLGIKATPEIIEKWHPDEVILATGAIPLKPKLPGIDQTNVIFAEDALLKNKAIGDQVLIIGGGLVGSEVADLLSLNGKDVVIVEMLSDIALERDRTTTFFLRNRLKKQGVKILLSSKVTKISDDEVIVNKEGEEQRIRPVDTIVLATGYASCNDLEKKMKSVSFSVHVVGDALKPRDAMEAIYEGAKLAHEL